MKKMMLTVSEKNALKSKMAQLTTQHSRYDLEKSGPIVILGICKPCKGGCGSLSQILDAMPGGMPTQSA